MRLLRGAWLLIFLVPLVPFAGKFCSVFPADDVYHSLVFLHERLPSIIALVAIASAVATALKLIRMQTTIGTLLALASPLPQRIQAIAWREAQLFGMTVPRIVYLDVEEALCCATIGGPLVILSRGFIEQLSDPDITLILRHELTHVRHRDPIRGVIVHLALGALLVPGFDAIERWLQLRREASADHIAARHDPVEYRALIARLSPDATEHSVCRNITQGSSERRTVGKRRTLHWARFIPAVAAASLLLGVVSSHASFDQHLQFLLTHHC